MSMIISLYFALFLQSGRNRIPNDKSDNHPRAQGATSSTRYSKGCSLSSVSLHSIPYYIPDPVNPLSGISKVSLLNNRDLTWRRHSSPAPDVASIHTLSWLLDVPSGVCTGPDSTPRWYPRKACRAVNKIFISLHLLVWIRLQS